MPRLPTRPRTTAALAAALLGATLAGVPGLAHAGGATEWIKVLRLEPSGRNSNVLVLAPANATSNALARLG
ncbi:MAG: hypothetical protein ACK52I_31130 [Pseudomonadota bacterium]